MFTSRTGKICSLVGCIIATLASVYDKNPMAMMGWLSATIWCVAANFSDKQSETNGKEK